MGEDEDEQEVRCEGAREAPERPDTISQPAPASLAPPLPSRLSIAAVLSVENNAPAPVKGMLCTSYQHRTSCGAGHEAP